MCMCRREGICAVGGRGRGRGVGCLVDVSDEQLHMSQVELQQATIDAKLRSSVRSSPRRQPHTTNIMAVMIYQLRHHIPSPQHLATISRS